MGNVLDHEGAIGHATHSQVVGNDEWEMYLTMKEPLGTRRIRMGFRKVAGEWKITFAEEAPALLGSSLVLEAVPMHSSGKPPSGTTSQSLRD